MKERDLRALEDRLESLAERLVELEDGQSRAGRGTGDVAQAVRELAAGMRRQDRVLSLNSFVAYLLFTVLLCATFFFLFRGRADDVAAERDQALAARDTAQARADAAARQLAERDAADRASAEILELLRRRRYAEAIAAHGNITALSPAQRQFLADAVDGARAELAAETALRARQAFDRRDYEVARETAAEGLSLAPEGEPAAELRYFLGASLDKLGRAEEAQAAYTVFLAAAPDHAMAPRARQRLRRQDRPADPVPADPVPVEPVPVAPSAAPGRPAPARPASGQSAPARSAPGQSAPAGPASGQSAPARSAPTRPAATAPPRR